MFKQTSSGEDLKIFYHKNRKLLDTQKLFCKHSRTQTKRFKDEIILVYSCACLYVIYLNKLCFN